MRIWERREIRTDLTKIVLINLVSQGFLLILTGTFWDDWIYYNHDRVGLWNQFMEAGRPSSAYWIELMWNLPTYGFRWFVFLLFMLTSIIFYFILRNVDCFSRKESLCICILYTIFPINDCRVILCDVVYTLGLTSFFIGASLFLLWLKKRNISFRVLSIFFFGYSFVINSLLAFYSIILLYLFYKEYCDRRRISAAFLQMFKYIDLILLPILFFIGKQLLFPVYGRYENYNIVTVSAIMTAAIRLPLAVLKQLKLIWFGIFECLLPYKTIAVFTKIIVAFIIMRLVISAWNKRSIKWIGRYIKQSHDVKGILLGVILFAVGLYPYILVRDNYTVELYGVSSRDSMLLGPGLALIMFYSFKIMIKNTMVLKIIFGGMLLSCIITCNLHYIRYQQDAYWQDALIKKLSSNDQIREAENILFLSDDSSGIDGTRFYSLNGNAYVAYGDQSRLFLNGYLELPLLTSEKSVFVDSKGYVMNDYNVWNDELDGVAVYNCDIAFFECIQLKLLELTNYTMYQEKINQMGDLNFYPIHSQEAIELLERYEY